MEVKTRSENYFYLGKIRTRGKIKALFSATDAYIRYHNIDIPVRFDLIIVIKKKNGYRIEHIEEAFYAPVNR
jgi:putative endonuclease